jgi:hypothetical protein
MDYRPPRAAADAGPARWIASRLSDQFGAVTRTVPAGYAAYARIFHPADPGAERQLRWSEVAGANGRVMHALAQYARISTPPPGQTQAPGRPGPEALAGISDPDTGELDPTCLRSLHEVLARHTPASAPCWFAMPAGAGQAGGYVASFGAGSPPAPPRPAPAAWQLDPRAPEFELPHRSYQLYAGPLADVLRTGRWVTDDWFLPQSPSLFWPDDTTWCAASETDFDSTLVGGPAALIAEILARGDLEAWTVGPGDSLAWDGDTVNER